MAYHNFFQKEGISRKLVAWPFLRYEKAAFRAAVRVVIPPFTAFG